MHPRIQSGLEAGDKDEDPGEKLGERSFGGRRKPRKGGDRES